MKTKLEKLALGRINELAKEAEAVVLKNNENMGGYAQRDSGFGQLNSKLYEIRRWSEALSDEA